MLAIKLAYRNLIGAGLRTWLNVIVLSFSFVVIIFFKGMLDGWDRDAKRDMIAWEVGGGQYWHRNYDPYDPFTLTESHGKIPSELVEPVKAGQVTPLLIAQGTIYPEGRIQSVLLKGIDPSQKVIAVPSAKLDTSIFEIPAVIGSNMASSHKLAEGDVMMLRWRNINGTFDAAQIQIVNIFHANVPGVDAGQVWIGLDRLREMMLMPEEATLLVTTPGFSGEKERGNFILKEPAFLLKEIDELIKTKSVGGSVFYVILLALALLAIFDTQILSIFRRQKEIGTYVAMGMTRRQVVGLFTAEGAMHAVFAAVAGAAYGIPLFVSQAVNGLKMPMDGDDYGIALAERIFPVYSMGLIISTILIVIISTTIVSYLPARKIAKMNPTEAIKGKMQ